MTYVVTDACIGSVDLTCVEVCPVNCIYGIGTDPNGEDEALMVVIDPEECIDCGKCEVECPVDAIHSDSVIPDDAKPWIEINAMQTGRGDMDGPAMDDSESKQDIADKALELHKAAA